MADTEACSKCGTPLAGRSSRGLCAACLFGAMLRPADDPRNKETEEQEQVIGRYMLLEKIGEGGFGSVYVAEQKEPVRRQVALKVLKLGTEPRAFPKPGLTLIQRRIGGMNAPTSPIPSPA